MHNRVSFLDFFKAIATQFIVFHHLANYGLASILLMEYNAFFAQFMFEYGRMAVQVFLVISGFLAASKINNEVHIGNEILKRYLRLIIPTFFAVSIIVLISLFLQTQFSFDNDWLPHVTGHNQIMSHLLLVQNILGQESLSTGVWYIAIDFQLFCMAMFLAFMLQKYGRKVARLFLYFFMFSSLFYFNTNSNFDNLGIYFFFSYGLGIVLYLHKNGKMDAKSIMILLSIFIISMLFDYRERIIVAFGFFLILLLILKHKHLIDKLSGNIIVFLSKISFSVFLTHFSCVIITNFLLEKFFIGSTNNLLWIIPFYASCILLGYLFYKTIENPSLKIINRIKFYDTMKQNESIKNRNQLPNEN